MSYQNLPLLIDPVAVSVGPIVIYWYAVMWLVAFASVYMLIMWRVRHGEGNIHKKYTPLFVQDTIFAALLGALLGGRFGYVLFYNFSYYIAHPLSIVSPYDFDAGTWTGIFGMSYHGGVVGVLLALWWRAHKAHISFLQFTDFVVPAVPLGYVFGRLGNFFNAELVGRITEKSWGMYFAIGDDLRHPSQLYEAVGEGLVLFALLWYMRNRIRRAGVISSLYIMGYGFIRFGIEFFRAPDAHIGFLAYNLTLGQILSFVMIVSGASLWFLSMRTKNVLHK